MDKEQLLKDFLGGYPESTHPNDNLRFLKYAVACAVDESSINSKAMLDAGVSPETVERLEVAYSWIRDTVIYVVAHYSELG